MAKDNTVEPTLVEFLRARSEEFGDRDALLFRPGFRYQRWSYADLWEGAGRIASMLQTRGLSKGDRALIWGPNCPQWVLAMFGCLRAGVIVVPLDVRSPREFVENVASRVDAKLSFVSRVTPDYHGELGVPEIDFEELEALSEDMPAPTPVDIGRDDLAEVMFTSGDYGRPEGRHAHPPQHHRQHSVGRTGCRWQGIRPADVDPAPQPHAGTDGRPPGANALGREHHIPDGPPGDRALQDDEGAPRHDDGTRAAASRPLHEGHRTGGAGGRARTPFGPS